MAATSVLEDQLSTNLFGDWSKVNWDELTQIHDFKWTYGQTPFSQIQFPAAMSVLYLVTVHFLQNYMKDRKPYTLKAATFVHNMILCMVSLAMFLGAAYGAFLKYQTGGFFAGWLCEQDPEPVKGVLFYWSYIFYLSKFYEYIDTYLLALKKKPVIFLHEWHHFVMPFVCYAGLQGKWVMALWTSCFWNSFVHVWMYYYYAVSTIGYNPWWKKYLTMLQIYQFVSGVLYTTGFLYFYFDRVNMSFDHQQFSIQVNQGCVGDLRAVLFMYAVNLSFLFLFSKFYVDSYLSSRGTAKPASGGNGKSHQSLPTLTAATNGNAGAPPSNTLHGPNADQKQKQQ